jgi:indole-3-acetate monooxygenase
VRERIVDAARDLAPLAAEVAAEGEAERRLPDRLHEQLVDAGLYRMCVAESLGGPESPPADLIDAVTALAAGDAAAGWCVAVCATSGILGGFLPQDTAAEVYGDPRAVVGGVFAPMGRAVAGEDTYTVDGRWRFASNFPHFDWAMGGCIVLDGDQPRLLDSGRPDVRLFLWPAADAELIDTWHVSGLRATGSHDMAVAGLEVPAARSGSIITDPLLNPSPIYAFPVFGMLAVGIASVALGTARGALDDLAELAGAKTPTMSSRKLAERADTQARMAGAEAGLRAADALLRNAVDAAWAAAQDGAPIPRGLRAGVRLGASHAVRAAAEAVDTAYALAGGSAIYETSPLQRRFRDVHAATQHMVVGPSTWELAGRVLLNLDVDDAQL